MACAASVASSICIPTKTNWTCPRETRQRNIDIGQWLSLLCCFVIVLPWLWIPPLRKADKARADFRPVEDHAGRRRGGRARLEFRHLAPPMAADDPESGYALVYWSVAILVARARRLVHVPEARAGSGARDQELPRAIVTPSRAVGLLACVLAAAPARCSAIGFRMQTRSSQPTDIKLMTRLALDIGQGLAFRSSSRSASSRCSRSMVALATGALHPDAQQWPARDHRHVSPIAKRGARTPRFPRRRSWGSCSSSHSSRVPCLVAGLGGPRLTIFGPAASLIATLVLVVTTLGASIFTVVAIHSSRRIRTIAAHIGRCVAPRPVPAAPNHRGNIRDCGRRMNGSPISSPPRRSLHA